MTKVYAVEVVVDEEYGGVEVKKVFAHRADAEQYVAENQRTMEVWFSEKPIKVYSIRELEVY